MLYSKLLMACCCFCGMTLSCCNSYYSFSGGGSIKDSVEVVRRYAKLAMQYLEFTPPISTDNQSVTRLVSVRCLAIDSLSDGFCRAHAA